MFTMSSAEAVAVLGIFIKTPYLRQLRFTSLKIKMNSKEHERKKNYLFQFQRSLINV